MLFWTVAILTSRSSVSEGEEEEGKGEKGEEVAVPDRLGGLVGGEFLFLQLRSIWRTRLGTSERRGWGMGNGDGVSLLVYLQDR